MNLHHLRHGWFLAIFLFCAAVVCTNFLHWLIFRFFRRAQPGQMRTGWGVQRHLGRPSRAIFLLTCVLLVLPVIPNLPEKLDATLRHVGIMAIVVALGWFFVGLIYLFQDRILTKYDLASSDIDQAIQARRVHTQLQVFRRLLIGFVVLITGGVLLWTFDDPDLWKYGTGLLTSAGIASLLLAAAAKSTASNLIAGIQIAFTELIRLDDKVVIEGKSGTISEITSSYVLVKLWDLRTLIVPLSYFIENPIENWTRQSPDILVYPYLYVDYSVPVEELRQEFERIVRAHPYWDGNTLRLHVTDLTPQAMQLRCLASSANSTIGFDLASDIREQMTAWIQQHYPDSFPGTRVTATLTEAPPQTPMPSA